MVSSSSFPWKVTPTREFPAKRWLRERYGFGVPASIFTRPVSRPASWSASLPREFPAKVWLAGGTAGWWLARISRNNLALS